MDRHGQGDSYADALCKPTGSAPGLPRLTVWAAAGKAAFPQPTKGASYGISQFFLFLQIVFFLRGEVEPRPGRQQGWQGQHPEQQGAERARQRQGRQPLGQQRRLQVRQQQPFFQEQQQVTAGAAGPHRSPGDTGIPQHVSMPGGREPPGIRHFEVPMKSPSRSTGLSANDSTRSSGSRGAANTGTKKASNAHAAKRQGEKASANKASSSKSAGRAK
jgi:hypothetical protein